MIFYKATLSNIGSLLQRVNVILVLFLMLGWIILRRPLILELALFVSIILAVQFLLVSQE